MPDKIPQTEIELLRYENATLHKQLDSTRDLYHGAIVALRLLMLKCGFEYITITKGKKIDDEYGDF